MSPSFVAALFSRTVRAQAAGAESALSGSTGQLSNASALRSDLPEKAAPAVMTAAHGGSASGASSASSVASSRHSLDGSGAGSKGWPANVAAQLTFLLSDASALSRSSGEQLLAVNASSTAPFGRSNTSAKSSSSSGSSSGASSGGGPGALAARRALAAFEQSEGGTVSTGLSTTALTGMGAGAAHAAPAVEWDASPLERYSPLPDAALQTGSAVEADTTGALRLDAESRLAAAKEAREYASRVRASYLL